MIQLILLLACHAAHLLLHHAALCLVDGGCHYLALGIRVHSLLLLFPWWALLRRAFLLHQSSLAFSLLRALLLRLRFLLFGHLLLAFFHGSRRALLNLNVFALHRRVFALIRLIRLLFDALLGLSLHLLRCFILAFDGRLLFQIRLHLLLLRRFRLYFTLG